ncbi:MAG: hypothetical protein OXF19_01245 [Hyphomicrobiales bacterium]|nr:hypothetical protein [Hyphomicrobiales bacterium]
MKTTTLTFPLFAAILILAGCVATPEPRPVEAQQSGDTLLTCAELTAQYKTNTEIAENKIARNRSSDSQDIILGALIWPGLADFNNADGHEGNALLDRNIYLRQLAEGKNCDTSDYPQQPTRYI